MLKQIANPLTIFQIRLSARYRLEVLRIHQRYVDQIFRMFQTGFQYTLVDSIATCVTEWLVSQSASSSSSFVVVPKIRFSF